MSRIAHNVFFSLKDPSEANKKAMVLACNKYLKDHPGVVFFAAGLLEPELARPVNDRDFDIALHVVFASRADHDRYQDAPLHNQFIAEQKEGWAKVRVFDSVVD
jgi:hypothetical protein